MNPTLEAPVSKHLKLKCDTLLSNFAFSFNLRRCTEDELLKTIRPDLTSRHGPNARWFPPVWKMVIHFVQHSVAGTATLRRTLPLFSST
jgi:hypothetical protein